MSTNDERLNEKVAKLETRVDLMSEDIGRLKENSNLLYRLSSMMEQQIQTNKELKEQSRENTAVFKSIDTNLANLHNGQERLAEKIDTLNSRVDNLEDKVSELEDVNNEQTKAIENKGAFNVVDFFAKDGLKFIGLAILGAILISLGLKF